MVHGSKITENSTNRGPAHRTRRASSLRTVFSGSAAGSTSDCTVRTRLLPPRISFTGLPQLSADTMTFRMAAKLRDIVGAGNAQGHLKGGARISTGARLARSADLAVVAPGVLRPAVGVQNGGQDVAPRSWFQAEGLLRRDGVHHEVLAELVLGLGQLAHQRREEAGSAQDSRRQRSHGYWRQAGGAGDVVDRLPLGPWRAGRHVPGMSPGARIAACDHGHGDDVLRERPGM